MEHCSGGLVSLTRFSEVRTNRFSGTGSSPARVQLLPSSQTIARLRIQEVIVTSTCLERYASRAPVRR